MVTIIGLQFVIENALVPLLTLVFLYMSHTTGELFLSPIDLSMVTKLSPQSFSGTSMGAWFLSFAMGNYLGGKIAAITGSHGEDGVQLTLAEGLRKYTETFSTIGYVLFGMALLIAVFNKPLKKLMHGVAQA